MSEKSEKTIKEIITLKKVTVLESDVINTIIKATLNDSDMFFKAFKPEKGWKNGGDKLFGFYEFIVLFHLHETEKKENGKSVVINDKFRLFLFFSGQDIIKKEYNITNPKPLDPDSKTGIDFTCNMEGNELNILVYRGYTESKKVKIEEVIKNIIFKYFTED